MNNYIWLIGGSLMAIPMCREIKRRAFQLLLSDKNPYCAARQYADVFTQLDTYDESAHLDFAKTLSDPPQAVLTIGTDAGPTVSTLSAFFGLPGIDPGLARLVKNKIKMRQHVNLAHPVWLAGGEHGLTNWLALAQERGIDPFPCLIKLPQQVGSRGQRVINSSEDFKEAIKDLPDSYLIEELLQGEDVFPAWREKYNYVTAEAAFDFFMVSGQPQYINGALRMFWLDQPGLEAGHINPFFASDEVLSLAQQAAERLGVTWGPFKIDVMLDRRYGWILLECATRLSGGFDHMITSPLATGKDITAAMLDLALGQPWVVEATKDMVACAIAPRLKPGMISGWQNTSTADHVFYMTDSEIRPLVSNQDRPLFVIAAAKAADKALQKALVEASKVRPLYQGGV